MSVRLGLTLVPLAMESLQLLPLRQGRVYDGLVVHATCSFLIVLVQLGRQRVLACLYQEGLALAGAMDRSHREGRRDWSVQVITVNTYANTHTHT
jgi:hypothetical protein